MQIITRLAIGIVIIIVTVFYNVKGGIMIVVTIFEIQKIDELKLKLLNNIKL